MKRRKKIPLSVQLAAALAELEYFRKTTLPFAALQAMDTKTYLRRFEWDHVIYHAWDDAVPHFTGITPRLVADHRTKTAKIDIPAIAKSKRIRRAEAAHQAKMAEKLLLVDVRGDRDDGCSSRPKSRPVDGSKASKFKRHMDGRVSRR